MKFVLVIALLLVGSLVADARCRPCRGGGGFHPLQNLKAKFQGGHSNQNSQPACAPCVQGQQGQVQGQPRFESIPAPSSAPAGSTPPSITPIRKR